MKRNYLILTVLVVVFVCLLPPPATSGGQERTESASGAEAESTAPESATSPAEAEIIPEVNEPRPSEGLGKPAPAIMFEEVVHDFGEIGPGTKNVCEFKFTNTGDGVLKITKVSKTCGCTVPELSKKEYAPGESGTLKVKYHSGRRSGVAKKRLFVYSNDKARPKVELTIKARISPKVDYQPRRLNLSLRERDAGCPKITLTSLDGKPFAIKRFKSTADCITADVDSSEKATKFVIEARVDIEKLRKVLQGRIDIGLTHPECDTVIISFDVLPRFEFDPRTLIVFNAEPQKSVTRKVWLLNNYGEDFEVASASSKEGIIKVASQKRKGNRYEFELEITPPAAEGGKRFFTDVFFVNIKGGQTLEITCRGFYSRKAGDKK